MINGERTKKIMITIWKLNLTKHILKYETHLLYNFLDWFYFVVFFAMLFNNICKKKQKNLSVQINQDEYKKKKNFFFNFSFGCFLLTI
jgi:hypothetical protein